MAPFLHAVAAHNVSRPLQNGPILTGWCSWYHYYERISAANLRENFAKLAAMKTKVPTNVAVVDDGYMTAWGDWDSLKPGLFPGEGLKQVAKDIRAHGMKPGLWLAPFACDKWSKIAKQHPDWIILNDEGRVANSSNCGKWFYGLDVTNPNVREYVYGCVRRAVFDWGFKVLKIDFLYAACLSGNGKYDLSMTRAEAMHLALQTIRAAAGPDVFLIGCGCPIGSGIGYVDGMRVSADTGPTWYPAPPFPYWDNGTLPALRAMIRNSISRAPLGHRWWHNDPDCLLLGDTTRLTDAEVASAASIIAMTCGMMLLSDDLTKVSVQRMNIATKIFPMTGATAIVLDLHSTNDGLPSLLRLWCTDRYQPIDNSPESSPLEQPDFHRESTLLARSASFSPDEPLPSPSDRKRSCVSVTKGLGTWTVLSVSNWTDKAAVANIPAIALHLLPSPSGGWTAGEIVDSHDNGPISEHGFHTFSFWSSEYSWRPDPRTNARDAALSKELAAHATEIFHFKRVNPKMPEYIGSDLHFSCGYEVKSFEATSTSLKIQLRKDCDRAGYVFLYVPRMTLDDVAVTVAGKDARWQAMGNTPDATKVAVCIGRVIRVPVAVKGDGSRQDGEILVTF
jgi:alpha-galactosidase